MIEGWKLDVSLWFAGVPGGVEPFQAELQSRLDGVLNHGVRTLDELDGYLCERGLPARVL